MKRILITDSFLKRMKGLRRHFSEQDVLDDARRFLSSGFGKGESELKRMILGEDTVALVKLRIRVRSAAGRYLVAIVNDEDLLPVFIDLKTGRYGKNMTFSANRNVVSMLERAFEETLLDYVEHTDGDPRLTVHPPQISSPLDSPSP